MRKWYKVEEEAVVTNTWFRLAESEEEVRESINRNPNGRVLSFTVEEVKDVDDEQ